MRKQICPPLIAGLLPLIAAAHADQARTNHAKSFVFSRADLASAAPMPETVRRSVRGGAEFSVPAPWTRTLSTLVLGGGVGTAANRLEPDQ